MHSTGRHFLCQRMRNASGIVSYSGAKENLAVMADVSSKMQTRNWRLPDPYFIALYEADKLAHEEAIRNGGVSSSFLIILRYYSKTHDGALIS